MTVTRSGVATRTDVQWSLKSAQGSGEKIIAYLEYKRKHVIDPSEIRKAVTASSTPVVDVLKDSQIVGNDRTKFSGTSRWLVKQARSYRDSTQSTQSQNTQSQNTQPQSTQPQSTQPQSTQPQSTQPQSTQPQSTQPQSTQPQSTQPQSTQPQSTQSKSSNIQSVNDVCIFDWDTLFILNFGNSEKTVGNQNVILPSGLLYQEQETAGQGEQQQGASSQKVQDCTFRKLLLAFLIRALKREMDPKSVTPTFADGGKGISL